MSPDPAPANVFPLRVRLVDGRELELRAIQPTDREALVALHEALGPESRYFRYFTGRRRLPEREVRHYLEVDQRTHAGVGAWLGERLIGHAIYDRLDEPGAVELALEVADAEQGLGVGTAMLEALAELAQAAGFARLVAHVLPTNRRMLRVFADLGFAERATLEEGVVRVELELASWPGFEAARRRRALGVRAGQEATGRA